MSRKDTAPTIDRVIYFDENDDICYSAPRPQAPVKPVAPQVVFVTEMDELEFMEMCLADLRSGKLPMVTKMSDQKLDEIDSENIGQLFSTKPYRF